MCSTSTPKGRTGVDKIRIRWLLAIVAALALVLGGVAYANWHARSADSTEAEADNPAREAPGGDENAAEEHESDAVADPNAQGSGPVAFTVAGHSAYIDTTTLKSVPPAKKTPRTE